MDFDFSAVLVLATIVTGGIWLADVLLWKPKRTVTTTKPQSSQASIQNTAEHVVNNAIPEPVIVEYARSFFPVILAVLVLRSFLVEPFRIPSGSMMPTLLAGDFILVNKYDYGVRLPVLNSKVVDLGQPERGDVAVFRFPKDPTVDYIKRVVGLPGDTIQYKGKQIFVNGELASQKTLGTYVGAGEALYMTGVGRHSEKLGDVEHEILVDPRRGSGNGTFVVPEGQYFVMGDNRDNSNDSRFWGFVPDENLVGRAFMIWMNWDSVDKRISWERIGNFIE